nr:hypothetical protein [Bifidobacterium pullorum]
MNEIDESPSELPDVPALLLAQPAAPRSRPIPSIKAVALRAIVVSRAVRLFVVQRAAADGRSAARRNVCDVFGILSLMSSPCLSRLRFEAMEAGR